MSRLHDSLVTCAARGPGAQVYVAGGWVDSVPTVPLEAGVGAVAQFAHDCWLANLRLQHELIDLRAEMRARHMGKD